MIATMSNGFYISTDKSRIDIALVSDFLSNRSYWAAGRSRETIERSIENSLCFSVFNPNGGQAGFARVVSDFAVFAWLLDVFILENYRGKGLGKMLLTEIMGHKDLQTVKRWGLATRDAHRLYEKFGFKPLSKPEMMMELI